MFTRDSKILSHRLTTPLTAVANAVGDVFKPTYNQIIKYLFANNEQGFAYDPNDLTTMYQDAAGTVPVTAVGQAVGLVLDKSKGLVLGPELFNTASVSFVGESSSIVGGGYRIYSSNGTVSGIRILNALTPSKMYVVEFTIQSIADIGAGIAVESISGIQVTQQTTGRKKVFIIAQTSTFFLKRMGICDYMVSDISCKEILGNHAYQTTSSMRTLLVANPQRLDYDTVDDKLITNLPAQLTGCTVIRAVPNVGTQILTGQTIPATYEDNKDHCGLIVINRALTATETSQITKLFNKAAGV